MSYRTSKKAESKIYLGGRIENESKDLQNRQIKELIIQRTFINGSTEYLITSVCGYYNNKYYCTKIVKFVEDSAVETIYSLAFSFSSIEKIYFPASLKELEKGWCY